jgi:hypothetical protein
LRFFTRGAHFGRQKLGAWNNQPLSRVEGSVWYAAGQKDIKCRLENFGNRHRRGFWKRPAAAAAATTNFGGAGCFGFGRVSRLDNEGDVGMH